MSYGSDADYTLWGVFSIFFKIEHQAERMQNDGKRLHDFALQKPTTVPTSKHFYWGGGGGVLITISVDGILPTPIKTMY